MHKKIKLIGLSVVVVMLTSCVAWSPTSDIKPIYVNPRSGAWSYQQPSAQDVMTASQNPTSYLSKWGPTYYPGLDYTEPIALGTFNFDPGQPIDFSQPSNLLISPDQLYKNPNLTNPRALTCYVVATPTTAAANMLICR
jgi:hypothetical protein